MSADQDSSPASGQDELGDEDDQGGLFGSGSEDEGSLYGSLHSVK